MVLALGLSWVFFPPLASAQETPSDRLLGLPDPSPGTTRTIPKDISGGFRVVDRNADGSKQHYWDFKTKEGPLPFYQLTDEEDRTVGSSTMFKLTHYNNETAPPAAAAGQPAPAAPDTPYAVNGQPGRHEITRSYYLKNGTAIDEAVSEEKYSGGQLISGTRRTYDPSGGLLSEENWNATTQQYEGGWGEKPFPPPADAANAPPKSAGKAPPAGTTPADDLLQKMVQEQSERLTNDSTPAPKTPAKDEPPPAPATPPALPPAAPEAPAVKPTGAEASLGSPVFFNFETIPRSDPATLQEDPEVDEFYARLREHLAQVVADLVARRERMVAGLGGKTWRPDTSSPAATASAVDVFKQASGPIKIVRELMGTLDTHHENWRRGDMSSKEFYQLGYRLVTDTLYDPTGDQGGLWGALQTEINARFFGICEFYAMVEENHQYLAAERVKKYVAPDVTYDWWAKDQQKDADTVSDDVQHIASLVPRIRASRERLRQARAKWIGALSAWEQYARARVQEEGDVHDRARQVIADTLGKFTDTDYVILHAANSSHGGVPLRSEWADLQLAPGAPAQFYLTGCAADPVASLQATPGTVAGVPPKPPAPDKDDSEFSRLSRLVTLDHARAKLAEDRAAAYLELATADALRIATLQEKIRSPERRQLDPRQREMYNQIDQENIAQCQQDARDELAARQRAIQDGYDYTDKANATAALLDKEYRRISSGGG